MATKTIKIRIKDANEKAILKKMAGKCNFVWNYCNRTAYEAIRSQSKWLNGFDLQKLTAGSSKGLRINCSTIQEICAKHALNRSNNKKIKLRWRSKKSLGWIPFKKNSVQFKDGKGIYYGQEFKLFQPERIPAVGTHGAGQFCEDARGRWYLCISVKYEMPHIPAQGEVGIDLGLKTLATLSNGIKVKNGRYSRKMKTKLADAQRGGHKRRAKTIHAKIKNQRLDYLHKASTQIVLENKLIVVGKLSVKKLIKTKMAKSIHDAAPSMFKTMLEYKASALQRVYVEVNETNTTRTCSSCGVIPDSSPKGLKGLSVREWVCSECGAIHDRDINAALNILRLGHQSLMPEVA